LGMIFDLQKSCKESKEFPQILHPAYTTITLRFTCTFVKTKRLRLVYYY